MSASERTIPASEAAELAGALPANLRDWRRRGLLDGIGERKGSRGWLCYSASEVELLRMLARHESLANVVERWRASVVRDQRLRTASEMVGKRCVFATDIGEWGEPTEFCNEPFVGRGNYCPKCAKLAFSPFAVEPA